MLTLVKNQIPHDMLQLAHPVNQLHIDGENFDDLMAYPRLAVVGSRKITPYGRGVTESRFSALTRCGSTGSSMRCWRRSSGRRRSAMSGISCSRPCLVTRRNPRF